MKERFENMVNSDPTVIFYIFAVGLLAISVIISWVVSLFLLYASSI